MRLGHHHDSPAMFHLYSIAAKMTCLLRCTNIDVDHHMLSAHAVFAGALLYLGNDQQSWHYCKREVTE